MTLCQLTPTLKCCGQTGQRVVDSDICWIFGIFLSYSGNVNLVLFSFFHVSQNLAFIRRRGKFKTNTNYSPLVFVPQRRFGGIERTTWILTLKAAWTCAFSWTLQLKNLSNVTQCHDVSDSQVVSALENLTSSYFSAWRSTFLHLDKNSCIVRI